VWFDAREQPPVDIQIVDQQLHGGTHRETELVRGVLCIHVTGKRLVGNRAHDACDRNLIPHQASHPLILGYTGYVDTYNSGCDYTEKYVTPISCGETVCGTSGVYFGDGSWSDLGGGGWLTAQCVAGPCGDLDRDSDVDYDDDVIFLSAFGGPVDGNPPQDGECNYDHSGAVGMADYAAWLDCYRADVGTPLAAPPKKPTVPKPGPTGPRIKRPARKQLPTNRSRLSRTPTP
jgi:hypothetical protein